MRVVKSALWTLGASAAVASTVAGVSWATAGSGISGTGSAATSQAAAKPTPTSTTGNNGNGNGNDAKNFTLVGNPGVLYPGASRSFVLTAASTNNFPIRITALSARVTQVTKNGADITSICGAGNLTSLQLVQARDIPANGFALQDVSIGMIADAADACQGAAFTLAYGGTAVKP